MADTVKMEDGATIKADPDRETSAPSVDDYEYEDTGELDMPRDSLAAWLIRLPKSLYDNWASVGDDEPIQLGHVRQFKNSNKFHLHLNPQIPQSQAIPKRYEMRTTAPIVHNTFVFTEKDLPGFKSKRNGAKQEPGAERQSRVDKFGRYQPYRRRAIPKQTALAAYINKEMACIPLDVDVESRTKRLDIEEGKGQMTILTGDVRRYAGSVLEPDIGKPTARGRTEFDTFITNTAPAKSKSQENKTARIPLNELLDKLLDCFKKYRYWSMTALRQELRQPESYLRSTLPRIADQVRSGPFNNNWKLKPEAELQNVELAVKDESAPQLEGDGASTAAEDGDEDDEDDDEDDDDLQMEDVGL